MGGNDRLRSVSLFSFPFVSFHFKGNIPVGGVVIAQVPEVGQVVAEIDEIETRDPVSIYLLLVNQFVPEQCRWDFGLTALEENRSSYYHSAVTSQQWQFEDPVSVSDATTLARSQHQGATTFSRRILCTGSLGMRRPAYNTPAISGHLCVH
jgi:hypothetical protein